jgi:hypothetical protein
MNSLNEETKFCVAILETTQLLSRQILDWEKMSALT